MKRFAQTISGRPGGFALLAATVLLLLGSSHVFAQSLRGSPASLDRQNAQAGSHGYSYLQTPGEVTRFVQSGYLVPVVPGRDMDLHQVSFPYTRPEIRVFVQRLASQYRAACGEKLVVTSLTRPISTQPVNASDRSVHPTGMAVDLRRSSRASCRDWLESTLLYLEGEGILEATRERNPPHYHLAVFSRPYSGYLASIEEAPVDARDSASDLQVTWTAHVVRRGETLTSIATRHGSAVSRLRAENGLRSDRLMVGQELRIPTLERRASGSPSPPSVEETGEGIAPGPAARFASSEAVASTETVAGEVLAGSAHTVARGESLWLIARRYGTDEAALRRANGLSGNRIYVGQELTIPGSRSSADARPAEITHRVTRGESLWTISRAYGVDENALRAANGLRGSRIVVGQTLTIPPDGAGVGSLHYTVARGESLWTIADRHGTTVDEIRRTNGMDTTRIYVGQVLEVPVTF